MRIDGNIPVTTSNNTQEKVPEKSLGSDFNNALRSSVKSKSNNSFKKSSTYSDDNKLSKENSKATGAELDKNSTNNEIEKCRVISGDNGQKSNVSTEDIKKVIDNNVKSNIEVDKVSKNALDVNNYDVALDLLNVEASKDSKAFDNNLASTVEKVIDNIKEKTDELDVNSIMSVLIQITDILNNKAEATEYSKVEGNLLAEINSILDNKILESKDSILSFFQNTDDNYNIKDVLENLSDVLSNGNDKLSQNNAKGLFTILESLETKVSEDVSLNNDMNSIFNSNTLNKFISEDNNLVNNNDNLEVLLNSEISEENKSTEVLNLNKELINQIKTFLNDNKEVSSNSNTQNILDSSVVHVEEKIDILNDTSSNNSNSDDLSGNKDEQILKSILNDGDTSNTINRATTFAGTFNNVNVLDGIKEASKLVKAEHLAEEIIETVKYMETNNVKELTVKINPRNLGELSIKILQEDGILKAQIKASTKDGYEILSRNVSSINKELSNQNLKIENVNISLNDDTTFFKGSSFESNANNFNNNQTEKSNISKNINNKLDEDEILEDNDSEILNNINMLA